MILFWSWWVKKKRKGERTRALWNWQSQSRRSLNVLEMLDKELTSWAEGWLWFTFPHLSPVFSFSFVFTSIVSCFENGLAVRKRESIQFSLVPGSGKHFIGFVTLWCWLSPWGRKSKTRGEGGGGAVPFPCGCNVFNLLLTISHELSDRMWGKSGAYASPFSKGRLLLFSTKSVYVNVIAGVNFIATNF